MIKFVNGTPIISEDNIRTAINEMHNVAFLMALFENEKPKKKTVKKWRQAIITWAKFWEVQHQVFNAIITSNARKLRAMQECDGLIITVQDIICNVCMTTKDGPNKDSLLRAQEILNIIRQQVGWDIHPEDEPEVEVDEPADTESRDQEDGHDDTDIGDDGV